VFHFSWNIERLQEQYDIFCIFDLSKLVATWGQFGGLYEYKNVYTCEIVKSLVPIVSEGSHQHFLRSALSIARMQKGTTFLHLFWTSWPSTKPWTCSSIVAVAACNKVVFGSRFAVAHQKLSCKKRAEVGRGNTKPQRIVIKYVLLTSEIGSDRKRM
jgi:hypothetical protein